MTYCSECGTDVGDAKFCPECGTEVNTATERPGDIDLEETGLSTGGTETDDELDEDADEEPDEGIQVGHIAASLVMALLVGAIVAFAFTNIGGSAILFFVTLGGVTYYLYDRKQSARSAVGSGLYIFALWLPMSPILFYIPLMGSAEEGTAEGAGQMVGSVLGMVIWGFVFFLIGLVVFAIGYFVNRGVDTDEE